MTKSEVDIDGVQGSFSKEHSVKNADSEKRLDDAAAFDEFQEKFGDPKFNRNLGLEAIPQWRAARSIKTILHQVNNAFPNRSKISDGIVGDERHCPDGKGKSDHCPNIPVNNVGVVTAIDITHDPKNGCDVDKLAIALIASRDKRIKYMIRNQRICSSYNFKGRAAWEWGSYSGHPHDKHIHISVSNDQDLFDNTDQWSLSVKNIPA